MKGDQWSETSSVPHVVPTRSLIEVIAMEEMLNGEWKIFAPATIANMWWEDMKLLSGDQYWDMESKFRLGNWRVI